MNRGRGRPRTFCGPACRETERLRVRALRPGGLDETIGETHANGVEIQPRPTPRVERTLERAGIEATRRGHDYLGTEHLLLAVIADPDGIAGRVLRDLGVDEVAAQRVREIMDSPGYNS